SLAFWMVGTIAFESEGTIANPLAPAEIRFSIAATWPSLSPSNLPAAVIRLSPSSFAVASAPSRILTKNGLVSVLVIRPTVSAARAALATPQSARPATAAFRNLKFLMTSSRWNTWDPGPPGILEHRLRPLLLQVVRHLEGNTSQWR